MEELTIEERRLIVSAIDLMFQSGLVRGDLNFVTKTVDTARAIKHKLAVDADVEDGRTASQDGPASKMPAISYPTR